MKTVNVILTGGVGSRLWPLSRKSKPKQYLDIFGGKSLFEMTVRRNQNLVDKVIVVGNIDNCHLSKLELKKSNVDYLDIVESTPRNTAAAIAFAAFASDSDDILLITPSDHVIEQEQDYNTAVAEAIKNALQNFIVTFGIIPTKAETGFGYIEHNENEVVSFREKPDEKTALEFLKSGNFLWNSGMFCFKASVFLTELKTYAPDVYEKSKTAWERSNKIHLDYELSVSIPSISIDYAVLEHSKKIKVIPSQFKWSDLGSFESIYDYLVSVGHPVDESGNMVIGTDKHTSFLGVKNTIFVHTEDAYLILNKYNSQDVKVIYDELERTGSHLIF